MTPEEIQRTMEFILASQASAAVRMDQLEESHNRVANEFAREMAQLREEQRQQKETVDALLGVTNNLVKISENVVHRARRLETRADSIEEIIKVLRELLEANLRRPEHPNKENS